MIQPYKRVNWAISRKRRRCEQKNNLTNTFHGVQKDQCQYYANVLSDFVCVCVGGGGGGGGGGGPYGHFVYSYIYIYRLIV